MVATAMLKVTDRATPLQREYIDASPRGDPARFVRVADDHTLQLPDRRGSNRIDSLRNTIY